MNLRQRIGSRYAAISALCLLLLVGLIYHEFVIEPWMNHYDENPKLVRYTPAEAIFHLAIPGVLLVGWLVMARTFREVELFAQRVEKVDAESLNVRLPRTGTGDEIDRLAEVFNRMSARLEGQFKHIREFTLHASHELKTPLTIMRAQLETFLQDHAQDLASDQREWVQSQIDEVQRMAGIVDSLTFLTKADAGIIAVEMKPVQLDDLVRECFEDAQVLGELREVQVSLRDCATAQVLGDRHRLRQLLLNLADNAVKYNVPGGKVGLSLLSDAAGVDVFVSNTGPGVPEDIRGREFERFVRGADSRIVAADGCGLGLAICAWIVHAHHGTIDISTGTDGITRVHVRLPRAA